MEEVKSIDSLDLLRSKKQDDMQSQRQKSRDLILSHNRMKTLEDEIENNVSLKQVKGLILELDERRNKKLDVPILKKIKISCSKPEFIEAFFKTRSAFEALTSCLRRNDAEIRLEAVGCLANLVCGPHKLCFKVAKTTGAYLISYLTGSSHYLQSQSAWAIRNIVNDCLKCYTKLKAQGVLPALLKAVKSPMPDVMEAAIYALSACLKYGEQDAVTITEKEYTDYFLKIIEEQVLSLDAVREAAFVLFYMLYIRVSVKEDCSHFNIEQILKCIKNFLFKEDYLTALVLIRSLGYLTIDSLIAEYLSSSALFNEIASHILSHSSHFLKKEFLWVLTNISASQVIDVNHNLFVPLLKLLEIFLTPLDSAIYTALYYICCTATQNKNIYSSYEQHGIVKRIEGLTVCGVCDIENASKMCIKIIKNPL